MLSYLSVVLTKYLIMLVTVALPDAARYRGGLLELSRANEAKQSLIKYTFFAHNGLTIKDVGS